MTGTHYIVRALGALALAASLYLAPVPSHAQPPAPTTPATSSNGSSLVCTNFQGLASESEATQNGEEGGVLDNIIGFIKPVVSTASEDLFHAFTDNQNYELAVDSAITLMIVIYGVSFMIGVVQPSFGQLLIRLIKVGIIYAVISPGGWTFFSDYVVTFFNDGTDEIIGTVMEIGTGAGYQSGDSPFIALDNIANLMISPDMIIAVIGSVFNGGPYGFMMGAMLGFAVMGFLMLLLEGLKSYALCFIVRALLLGVAPIFIVFTLFDKTKPLFTSWVNSLVNMSLRPILFFTFISFFIVMMQHASESMLGGAELCWSEGGTTQGTQNKIAGWYFKMPGENAPRLEQMTWKGPISCMLNGSMPDGSPCKEFPINILDILSFVILVYVAQRFAGVIDRLAGDISSITVNLGGDLKHTLPSLTTSGGLNTNAGDAAPKQASTARPGGPAARN